MRMSDPPDQMGGHGGYQPAALCCGGAEACVLTLTLYRSFRGETSAEGRR
jgi:hypothetical protein